MTKAPKPELIEGPMLDAARGYAARGWHVFPVHGIDPSGNCTCGAEHNGDGDKGKHPVPRTGLKAATRDPDKIEAWWGSEAGQHWNIGIRTGEVSGITVLDIDVGPGKRGAETWAGLIAGKGEPETISATTGSGGTHAFFAYNSSLNTSSNTLGPGVDCRNDNGYVVGPPSKHRSGGVYAWDEESKGFPLAPLPAHLSKRVETRGRRKADDPRSKKYTVAQVEEMLTHIDAGDRDLWRSVGIILGRQFHRSEEAWTAYETWSASWGGAKGRNHDEIMRQAFHDLSQEDSGRELSIGTIIFKAIEGGWVPEKGDVDVNQFIYLAPDNAFFYKPAASFWVADAVNAAVGQVQDEAGNVMKASVWVQKNFLATSRAEDPAVEEVYWKGYDSMSGYFFESEGGAVLNTYRPPDIVPGDARLAGPFLDHVCKVFNKPGDADQFLDFMAHRVQKQSEKPRFALLLAGEMGTGKDTAVEFCVPAIGPWNVANIEPAVLDTNYNDHCAAALVRLSETANLHEMNKWVLNERLKVLIAGTPDTATINPKYGKQYQIRMYCGVVITTNHLATGIYIPPGDRRYDVIEAATRTEMGLEEDEVRAEYFGTLWDWFGAGGASHVAAFLLERDINRFSAANGQRKTEAHKTVVTAGYSSDYWLLDALASLGDPDMVRSDVLHQKVLEAESMTPKEINARIAASLARIGYIVVRNPRRADGRWPFSDSKKLANVYASRRVTPVEAMERAGKLQMAF
jgi:hypothetical protein